MLPAPTRRYSNRSRSNLLRGFSGLRTSIRLEFRNQNRSQSERSIGKIRERKNYTVKVRARTLVRQQQQRRAACALIERLLLASIWSTKTDLRDFRDPSEIQKPYNMWNIIRFVASINGSTQRNLPLRPPTTARSRRRKKIGCCGSRSRKSHRRSESNGTTKRRYSGCGVGKGRRRLKAIRRQLVYRCGRQAGPGASDFESHHSDSHWGSRMG